MLFEIFAYDTRLHASFVIQDSNDLLNAISKIELRVSDIKDWMTRNLLKLNAEKKLK